MSAGLPIDSTDLVLLLLWAPSGSQRLQNEIPGITRLEKLLYLVDRETDVPSVVEDAFKFEAYDFGPYSREVYEAVEILEAAGLVREEIVPSVEQLDSAEQRVMGLAEEEGGERRFILTEDGQDVARLLATRVSSSVMESLSDVKDRYGSLSLRQLIRYVYTRYPDSAERSKIRRDVLG